MGYASKEALLEYTQEKKRKAILYFYPLWDVAQLLLVSSFCHTMIWTGRQGNSAYKKYLKIAASTEELQRLLNDFADSQSLADDRIRLGDEYIYGKNMERPIAYTELKKVYPHVITGTTSNSRYLKGVTADGEEHKLCEFIVKKSAKDPHPDESHIFQIMIARNPNIYLGYR